MQTSKSKQLFTRAQQSIPGGVNSPVRAFRSVGGEPLFIDKAYGSKMLDVDGNEFIDYVGSWGPMIIGHANEHVLDRIREVMKNGLSFGAPTQLEIDLAEKIRGIVPSMELVRMVNSGTEATMSAIRAARGYTGRDKIIKFSGCYHGHADYLLVKAGSGVATLGSPDSPGVPAAFAAETLIAQYNNIDEVKELVEKYNGEVACIILEPVAGNMGVIPPKGDFLKQLRELCDLNGIVLIFDEVMTGFRVALGCAQEMYHVEPDLTCIGKIIGGGMPVGAYGGKKKIMERISPSGDIYQAGTLSGNPVAMAAGLATLEILEQPGFYSDLGQKVTWLCNEMEDALKAAGRPYHMEKVGGMFGFYFIDHPVQNFEDALGCDQKLFGDYFRQMLINGIYIAPSAFEASFMSAAHSEDDLAKTASAFKKSLAAI
ncbi:MAG: glutamate-1-semialdehyde 2,1-aminomutase [SAR324 cluster bacterium]|nr:glutamate-1-semialdehyde 2,1-aminomutase [SAR324 cluster bacterium]